MIRNHFTLLPLVILPLLGSGTAAKDPASFPAPAQDETALQAAMQTFKVGQRRLKKLITDPAANEQALLESLRGMESAALAALAEKPPHPEGLTEKELALFDVGFKRQLAQLLEQILAMQDATLRVDAAALKSGYDELSDVKKLGHQTYRDF